MSRQAARRSTAKTDATRQGTPTRKVRYQVAASVDGYIAGPNGEADWIPMDPDIDFAGLFAQFDTLLMGRRTFEGLVRQGHAGGGKAFGMTTIVVSRTLTPADHPGVTILADDLAGAVARLQAAPGKDIWLFGGGSLFRSMAALGLVDRVEIALVPTLLGQGLPLLPSPASTVGLALAAHRVYPKSGIVMLEYAVTGAGCPARQAV
jgi:dihydrofolate reductase